MTNYEIAVAALYKYNEANGYMPQQPDRSLSDEQSGWVYLRNVRGYMGKYSVKRGEFVPAK